MSPNGLILDWFGPDIGAANDRELMRNSELEEHVLQHLPLFDEGRGIPFVVFGDKGYNATDHVWTPVRGHADDLTPAQVDFNRKTSKVRVSVEHVFGVMRQQFQYLEGSTSLRPMDSPVDAIFKCAALLANIRNCFYPNQIAQYFGLVVPCLQEYLAGVRCV